MGIWSRSVAITKLSGGLVLRAPQVVLFPILAAASSVTLVVALFVPSLVVEILAQLHPLAIGLLQLPLLFVTYFGLAFVSTFFNVCVVHTTKVTLAGEPSRVFSTLWFAAKKVHLIAAWSVVSASVGLLMRALDELGERSGLAGKLLLMLVRLVLATAWSLMTVFVVPSMVYRGLGPFGAVRDSMETLRATWGDGVVRYYGVGIVAFVTLLPFLLLGVCGVLAAQIWWLSVPLLLLAGAGLTVLVPTFNLLTTVWQTVLYDYATTRKVPAGFSEDELETAFSPGW